jgi:hypothetical protein
VQQRVDVRERQRCAAPSVCWWERRGARGQVEAVAVAARASDASEAALRECVDLPDERGRAALVLGAQDGQRLNGGDELARRRRVLQQALRRASARDSIGRGDGADGVELVELGRGEVRILCVSGMISYTTLSHSRYTPGFSVCTSGVASGVIDALTGRSPPLRRAAGGAVGRHHRRRAGQRD